MADRGDVPTVAEFYESEYLPWSKADKRNLTRCDDNLRFHPHIEPLFGSQPPDEVERGEVELWQAALLTG